MDFSVLGRDVWLYITIFQDSCMRAIMRNVCSKFYSYELLALADRRKKISPIFILAARQGYKEIINWYLSYSKIKALVKQCDICAAAAKGRHFVLVKELIKNFKCDYRISAAAAKTGDLELVEYFHNSKCHFNYEFCYSAAKIGSLPLLKWAKRHSCYDHRYCQSGAINGGHLQIFKNADGNLAEAWVFEASIAKGHFNILKLVNLTSPQTFDTAVFYGNMQMVKYLEKKNCAISKDVMDGAIKSGSIKMIDYLLAKGYNLESKHCSNAARHGHLKVLKYLIAKGFKIDGNVAVEAVEGGNLDIVKFLYESNYIIPVRASFKAKEKQFTEISHYLLSISK